MHCSGDVHSGVIGAIVVVWSDGADRVCVCVCCGLLIPGGDRSSVGSSGSVASARSSGSGQSAGSSSILHAQAEGVKVSYLTSKVTVVYEDT